MQTTFDDNQENIVFSLACSALDKIKTNQHSDLLLMASHLSCQRANTLGFRNWYQWQDDNSEKVIKSLEAICLDQKPVYYKRIDTDTLQAMIEFTEQLNHHYCIVLVLEDGEKAMSNMKYHNIIEIPKAEWKHMLIGWTRSFKDAEELFLRRTKQHSQEPVKAESNIKSSYVKEAPEGYWGDWSSDESVASPQRKPLSESQKIEELDDSEDEYYINWSKDPGTLTPGPEDKKGRILSTLNPSEVSPPAYEASSNMDPEMAALSKLTIMLQNTIPQQCHSIRSRPVALNLLPKVVCRAQSINEPAIDISKDEKEADRLLLIKSLYEIVEKAKLLGYKEKDILDMVQGIVHK